MLNDLKKAVYTIRKIKPLVLNLTNFVTMDFVANSQLAIGGAPIMSTEQSECEELVMLSNAIYINIGTLNNDFINHAKNAIKLAKLYNKPIIFDPVGSGATLIRSKIAREFTASADIIRGNASEVISLLDHNVKTHGVESKNSSSDARNSAAEITNLYNNVVIISGAIDIVTSKNKVKDLKFGSKIMPLVTGMGCSLTAVIAVFRSVMEDSFEAAEIATAYFGLCGNLAESKTDKPGTFRSLFIDELYKADFKAMEKFI